MIYVILKYMDAPVKSFNHRSTVHSLFGFNA